MIDVTFSAFGVRGSILQGLLLRLLRMCRVVEALAQRALRRIDMFSEQSCPFSDLLQPLHAPSVGASDHRRDSPALVLLLYLPLENLFGDPLHLHSSFGQLTLLFVTLAGLIGLLLCHTY